MKIIMLIGRHKSGKTQTINDIFDAVKSPQDIKTPLPNTGNPNDFEAEIIYNRKKIGFYSAGDTHDDVERAIDTYSQHNCDILVCANSFERSHQKNQWLNIFLQQKYPQQHQIIPIKIRIPILTDIINELK